MLSAGVLPLLLDQLRADGRLSEAGIGLAAMAEPLTFAVALALASAFLKPQRLRSIAFLATVVLAFANLLPIVTPGGTALIAVRALAGLPEGILTWIMTAMLARSYTPERWSGLQVTALTLSHLGLSVISATIVIPHFGANGGFAMLAATAAAGTLLCIPLADQYAPLPPAPEGSRGAGLTFRGAVALMAALLSSAAMMGPFIYLLSVARSIGLDSSTGELALMALTAGEVLGGAAATIVAARFRYAPVLVLGSVIYLIVWPLYGAGFPGWLFVATSAAIGFVYFFQGPYLYPMVIDADPTRRAAVQCGSASMIGGVIGPALAAWTIMRAGVPGILATSSAMMVAVILLVLYVRHFGRCPGRA